MDIFYRLRERERERERERKTRTERHADGRHTDIPTYKYRHTPTTVWTTLIALLNGALVLDARLDGAAAVVVNFFR